MAVPANDILLIATDVNGGDGFPNKIEPIAPITNEGWGEQGLDYQSLNYMLNNQGEWIKYINEEQIPDEVTSLQDQIDTIINTTLPNAITAAKVEMELKIGTIIEITGDATNPATLYGYGVWSAFGGGLTTVGVGNHTDDRAENKAWTDGQTEGEYQHVQTVAETALHSHAAGSLGGTTSSDGAHTHSLPSNVADGSGNNFIADSDGTGATSTASTGSEADHNHTLNITGSTANTGSSTAMNNTQPSIAVFKWLRTS